MSGTRGISRMIGTGLAILSLAVSTGVRFPRGGYGLILGLLGVLGAVNVIALGVWKADRPNAAPVTGGGGAGPSTAAFLRRSRTRSSLAIVGIVLTSSAVTAAAAADSDHQTLCLLLLLGLGGLGLINVSVFLDGA